jgi:hypothetical protein
LFVDPKLNPAVGVIKGAVTEIKHQLNREEDMK